MQLADYQQLLHPVTYGYLTRHPVKFTQLIQNQEHFARNRTFVKAADAFNRYRATDKHYGLLTSFEQKVAEELFSAIWIKERDATDTITKTN